MLRQLGDHGLPLPKLTASSYSKLLLCVAGHGSHWAAGGPLEVQLQGGRCCSPVFTGVMGTYSHFLFGLVFANVCSNCLVPKLTNL